MRPPSCLTSAPNCQLKVNKELLEYLLKIKDAQLQYNMFAVTCLPYVRVEGLYRKSISQIFNSALCLFA